MKSRKRDTTMSDVAGKKFYGLDMPQMRLVEEYDVFTVYVDGQISSSPRNEAIALQNKTYHEQQGHTVEIKKEHKKVYEDVR